MLRSQKDKKTRITHEWELDFRSSCKCSLNGKGIFKHRSYCNKNEGNKKQTLTTVDKPGQIRHNIDDNRGRFHEGVYTLGTLNLFSTFSEMGMGK